MKNRITRFVVFTVIVLLATRVVGAWVATTAEHNRQRKISDELTVRITEAHDRASVGSLRERIREHEIKALEDETRRYYEESAQRQRYNEYRSSGRASPWSK